MWLYVEANPAKGIEEQYILRLKDMTVCSLRKSPHEWTATVLEFGGLSSRTLHYDASLLVKDAKQCAEDALTKIGWNLTRKEKQ